MQYLKDNLNEEQGWLWSAFDALLESCETPLGLDLLATANFLLSREPELPAEVVNLHQAIAQRSVHKPRPMKPTYLKAALERLQTTPVLDLV